MSVFQTPTFRSIAAAGFVALAAAFPSVASAAVSVSWTSPANNSTFLVGTTVTPQGLASASGTTGTGVDFSIVMDSSGSMRGSATAVDSNGNTVNKPKSAWQREGAISLVNGLPDTATVSIIRFDANASAVIGQTLLDPAGRAAVIAAINGVGDAGPATRIDLGIDTSASTMLPGTPGFNQAMVVFSDGSPTGGNANASAAAAVVAGVESVDAVALPGSNVSVMQNIATNGNGTFVNATSDIGLVNNLLSGIGGSLPVGLASLEVTDPDGNTFSQGVGVGGVFVVPSYDIKLGNNIWSVIGTDTLGNTASASLNLIGVEAAIPLPATGILLLSVLGGGLGLSRLRRRA